MLYEKELPKPVVQPSLNRESSMGRGSFNMPSQTSFLGAQTHNIYGGNSQNYYDAYDDFHPFLDGRTAIGTNPNAQFGIGSSITSNDFQRLLDVCETDAELFTHNFEVFRITRNVLDDVEIHLNSFYFVLLTL